MEEYFDDIFNLFICFIVEKLKEEDRKYILLIINNYEKDKEKYYNMLNLFISKKFRLFLYHDFTKKDNNLLCSFSIILGNTISEEFVFNFLLNEGNKIPMINIKNIQNIVYDKYNEKKEKYEDDLKKIDKLIDDYKIKKSNNQIQSEINKKYKEIDTLKQLLIKL